MYVTIFLEENNSMKYRNFLFNALLLSALCCVSLSFKKDHRVKDNNLSDLKLIATKYDNDKKINSFDSTEEPHFNGIYINDYVSRQPGNYHQITSFNMASFFENLYMFSPANCIGSCGYVSLIQCMSYYDTFYNDDVIPFDYDRNDSTQPDEQSVETISPGVIRQEYYYSLGSYYSFCHSNMSYNLQSKLTVVRNILNNTDNDNVDEHGNSLFRYSIGGWDYQQLLTSFYSNYTLTASVNEYASSTYTNENYSNIIKDVIDSGNPAIVHIKKTVGNDSHYHSVVAYKYDSANIYANFGYGSYSTSLPLIGGSQGYTEIYGVYTLDYYTYPHSHSNNYIFDNIEHCGCNLCDEILFRTEPIYTNIPPTIYWMKDSTRNDEFYYICIKDLSTGHELLSYNLILNEMTFSELDWNYILSNITFHIGFSLTRCNTSFGYEDCLTTRPKPVLTVDYFEINQSEYGFADSYPGTNQYKQVTKNNTTFDTNRLRCGYIHNEFINLSPRKINAGIAYLEYTFICNIELFEVAISMWGINELTNSNNATAFIQYKDSNGSYQNLVDLYNDFSLSKNRTMQDHLSINLPLSTNTIRIYTTAEAIGDNNRGRLSIGELKVIYEA